LPPLRETSGLDQTSEVHAEAAKTRQARELEIMSERRIGAYGGTFDPIHNGHIAVVRAVARGFGLDEVLIVPAHRPPHKTGRSISDAYHRYAMAVLATLDDEGVKVSTLEITAPDKPYTFETVERLRQMYGEQAKLFFIMGADSFEEINTWREPLRLLRSVNLIVAARPGHRVSTSHLPSEAARKVVDLGGREASALVEEDEACCRVYLTEYVREDISSTDVRQRVREGESIRGMVPARVADYIEKYELYRR
jgi:nicotinate-nucleotide adenylyltransferase